MNLLMIDDDIFILADLKEKLNWKELGFDKIYTAETPASATKILEQLPVHIIICDIEMPGMNGLDFIERLRKSYIDIPCILLTSYAQFEYAQKAIQLNIIEYLLKPVPENTLISAVKKAIEKLRLSHKQSIAQKSSQYWLDESKNISEYFWIQAVRGHGDELHSLSKKLGYHEKQVFIPVILEYIPEFQQNQSDDPTLEFAIKNIAYEIFQNSFLSPRCVISLSSHRWLAVISIISGLETDFSPLQEQLEILRNAAETLMHIDFCIGVGTPVSYHTIHLEIRPLIQLLDNTINRTGKIIYMKDTPPKGTLCTQTEIHIWETLLYDKNSSELKNSLKHFLNTKAALLSMENMQEIRQDFTQAVYSFLKENQIQAHKLFGNKESDNLYQNSISSIHAMYTYCSWLVDKAVEYIDFSNNTQSAVKTIQTYLDAHYAEEIQRSDLSNIVFISPDHLSRLFKKETGLSLMQYVTHKRISVACDLLKQSHMPINAVAIKVGYSNFAYFSKIFREITGLTPMNFRREFRNNNCQGE